MRLLMRFERRWGLGEEDFGMVISYRMVGKMLVVMQ